MLTFIPVSCHYVSANGITASTQVQHLTSYSRYVDKYNDKTGFLLKRFFHLNVYDNLIRILYQSGFI